MLTPPTYLVSMDDPMSITDQVHYYPLQPITTLPLNHSQAALPLNLAMRSYNINYIYFYILRMNVMLVSLREPSLKFWYMTEQTLKHSSDAQAIIKFRIK